MFGTLFVVATPIGNLGDMTARGRQTLQDVEAVFCEDTRVTGKLLAHFEIRKPLHSLHEHSGEAGVQKALDLLVAGKSVAYTSDAGTPGVNDPGGKLVAACFKVGIPVCPIPGPSALTAAISVCGFPMDEFTYEGFVPHKKGRERLFQTMAARKTPSIFFETTHRIEKTLDQLEPIMGPSRLLFCGRELTKMHETLYRGTVAEVKEAFSKTSSKGEYVLILGPDPKKLTS
ncbi:MAG: 16S rRNA (cytidine(1402)-2'-O)-methyltransferase [bacterium]|nr:16S rRNA (cytidine(1402)-2'-O)-methyltransferase [bacterium]